MRKSASEVIREITGEGFSFSVILRGYRTREDLTQEMLAKKLKVTKSYISDLENKRRYVTVEQAKLFATKLKEPSILWIETAIQDMLDRAGVEGRIKIVA